MSDQGVFVLGVEIVNVEDLAAGRPEINAGLFARVVNVLLLNWRILVV